MRTKAYMALVVATGMLNCRLPARCEDATKAGGSVIQEIADDTKLSSEARAYLLLLLANRYLDGANESELKSFHNTRQNLSFAMGHRSGRSQPELLAERLCRTVPAPSPNNGPRPRLIAPASLEAANNEKMARSALDKALVELQNDQTKQPQLLLYFIASLSFERANDVDDARQCQKVLEKYIHDCEHAQNNDAQQVENVISILNLMSIRYLYVPIPIEDPKLARREGSITLTRETEKPTSSSDKSNFERSERLKLEAIALADRLPSENHVRRKAHRDLALWYEALGKPAESEREKRTLFKLVGSDDERILYPKQEGCGMLAWWKTDSVIRFGCGMG